VEPTREQIIEAAEKYIKYIKGLPDEKEPEVFEAELVGWPDGAYTKYGKYKFIKGRIEIDPDCTLNRPYVDFATDFDRDRFEQVKLAMSRKGQRFEGRRSSIHSNSAPEDAVFEYTGEFRPCPTVEWHKYCGEAYCCCCSSPVHILRLVEPKLELKKDWLYWDKKLDRPFRYIGEEGPKLYAEKHPDERLRPATLDDLAVELEGCGDVWAWVDSGGDIRLGARGNCWYTVNRIENDVAKAVASALNIPLICKEQADALGLN